MTRRVVALCLTLAVVFGYIILVIGDVAMMLFWPAVDALTGRTGHILMPG